VDLKATFSPPTLLIPNLLYLGSKYNAASREILIECNISKVVSTGGRWGAESQSCHFKGFQYFEQETSSVQPVTMAMWLRSFVAFVEEAEMQSRAVLVYCKSGNEAAAALCVGFLMRRHRWTLAKALAYIKLKRPKVNLSDEFINELAVYQIQLEDEWVSNGPQTMEECTGEGADIPGEFEFSEEHLSPASSVEDSKVDEMQEIQARKAKALRKWKRWCAVPLALTDMILEKRKTAVEDHLRSLFVAQKREELRAHYEMLSSLVQFTNILRQIYFTETKDKAIAEAKAIAEHSKLEQEGNLPELIDSWIIVHKKWLEDLFGTSWQAEFNLVFEQILYYFFCSLTDSIVRFLDRAIRSHIDANASTEVLAFVPLCKCSFPYMASSENFEKIYANFLARRLLLTKQNDEKQTEAHFEVEKLMEDLVREHNSRFSVFIDCLLKDAQRSLEQETRRKQRIKEKMMHEEATRGGPLVSARVLTANRWPCCIVGAPLPDEFKSEWKGIPRAIWPKSYILPAQVQQQWDSFLLETQGPHTEIRYLPHLGTAEMEMVIGGKKITAVVTTAMMCVLDRYKFGLQFFYEDLQIETGIPEKDLKSTLFSLISRMPGSQTGLLTKLPPGKTIETSDAFSMNTTFVSKLRKFRVPPLRYPPCGPTNK